MSLGQELKDFTSAFSTTLNATSYFMRAKRAGEAEERRANGGLPADLSNPKKFRETYGSQYGSPTAGQRPPAMQGGTARAIPDPYMPLEPTYSGGGYVHDDFPAFYGDPPRTALPMPRQELPKLPPRPEYDENGQLISWYALPQRDVEVPTRREARIEEQQGEQGYRSAGEDDGSVAQYPPGREDPIRRARYEAPGGSLPFDNTSRPDRGVSPLRRQESQTDGSGAGDAPYNTPGDSLPFDNTPRTDAVGLEPEVSAPPAARPGAIPTTSGPVTPGGNNPPAGRKRLNDQTRTEAFDPTLDKDDPDTLPQLLQGALDFAQHTFHLKNDAGGAVPAPDRHRERGARAFIEGTGAAPVELVRQINQVVNGAPEPSNMEDEAIWGVRRLEAIYRHYSGRGETDKANKAAFELVQYGAGMAAKYGAQARDLYHKGDLPGAAQAVIAGYNFVPDNRKMVMGADGKSVQVVDARTGAEVERHTFGPKELFDAALGLSNKSAYWNVIMHRAAAMTKTPGEKTPLQEEQIRSQIELNKARTRRADRPPVGRGGGGGGGIAPAAQALIDAIANKRAARGQTTTAGSVPVVQGSDDGATTQQTDPDATADDDVDLDGRQPAVEPLSVGGSTDTPSTGSVVRLRPPTASQIPSRTVAPPRTEPAPGGGRDAPAAGRPAAFDPEGSDYDYETARAAGLGPDKDNHWPSRDPKTGTLLKGKAHPTFQKGVDEDAKLGYFMRKRPDGRYESANPDEVPQQEFHYNGSTYTAPPEAATKPKPFTEPHPGKDPYAEFAPLAAKIPSKQGGSQVQTLLRNSRAEHLAEVKAWEKAKKAHDDKEAARVTSEGKAAKAAAVAAAKATFDLAPKSDEELEKITTGITTAFDKRTTDYQTLKDKKAPEAANYERSVFADGSTTPSAIKDLALDIRTSNPRVTADKALTAVDLLTRVGTEPHERGYRPVGRDALGNVILQINDSEGNPTNQVFHMRELAYKDLNKLVRKRFEMRRKAASPPEKTRAEGITGPAFGDYLYSSSTKPGEGLASDALRVYALPFTEAAKLGDGLYKSARYLLNRSDERNKLRAKPQQAIPDNGPR